MWQRFSSLSDDLLFFITAVNQCLIFLIPISFCTHPCLNALNKSTVFKRPKRHSSLTTVWKDWRKIGSTCIARGWIKNVSGADRDLADQAIHQLQLTFHGCSSHVVNRPAALYSFSVKRHSALHTFKVVESRLLLRCDVSQRAIRKRSSLMAFFLITPNDSLHHIISSAQPRPHVIVHHRVICIMFEVFNKSEKLGRSDKMRLFQSDS